MKGFEDIVKVFLNALHQKGKSYGKKREIECRIAKAN
jgi:hypothetical protein